MTGEEAADLIRAVLREDRLLGAAGPVRARTANRAQFIADVLPIAPG